MLTVEEIHFVKEHLVAFWRDEEQGDLVEQLGELDHFDRDRVLVRGSDSIV